MEFDSEELKEEDAKVNNERKRKRGVKRDAPESGINDETPSAKKRKKNQAQDPYFKMMMDLQKQQMEMQMEMQMKMMKETKEMEIQAQVDLRKYEEKKRKEEKRRTRRESKRKRGRKVKISGNNCKFKSKLNV